MIPNSAAARSVIVPARYEQLRSLGLAGEAIVRLPSRSRHAAIGPLIIGGEPLDAFEFEVRDVGQLRAADGRYVADGYLGFDFFLAHFEAMRFDFRSRMLTLEFRKTEDR